MKIRMTRQAFPRGGGAVLAAGNSYDLPRDVVKKLPKGSYRRAKQQTPPADKQQRGGKKK